MLTSVLQSANILGWIKVCSHLLRLTKNSKRHTLPPPRLVTQAISSLSLLLVLSYLTSAFDIWLHASSQGYNAVTSQPTSVSENSWFGRQINETRCTYYADVLAGQTGSQLCGLLTDFAHVDSGLNLYPNDTSSIGEASRTLTNTSEVNQVVFTSDQEAILVPATIPSAISYEATTVGVMTSCQS